MHLLIIITIYSPDKSVKRVGAVAKVSPLVLSSGRDLTTELGRHIINTSCASSGQKRTRTVPYYFIATTRKSQDHLLCSNKLLGRQKFFPFVHLIDKTPHPVESEI